ncbi:MAG: Omp28-related outer membrane protein [Saprospiraceae bacterium]|nr:Omp28-related outer membrane protein [Saprospiraceae bacterium]
MKNILLYTSLMLLGLAACEEKPVVIPDLVVGDRVVLVEELTGVNCPNCPDGTKQLQGLQETFGKDKLVLVAIHTHLTGAFSNLLPTSKEDFATPETDALVAGISAIEAVPSAAVNRVEKAGETTLFLGPTNWNALINEQIQQQPTIGLFMETTYNTDARTLTIDIDLAPDNTLTGEHRLTVYVTQDSIVDAQNINGYKEPNYVHRHILRDVISSTSGDLITEPLTGGDLIRKSYQVVLPAAWDDRHCSVIAFVHRGTGFDNKEVLQAVEKHVVD